MRHLLDIVDMSVSELDELLLLATDIIDNPDAYRERCKYKKLATLFFEPSTRTRLSFETAMIDLGGSVVGFESGGSSSASKGESVRDTAAVVGGYVDIIAMRHPFEGAAIAASQFSPVPVINAGDGGHCHPTQTLADLLTIKREVGRLDNLTIGFCGDLRYGRTVHSLINAMVRYAGNKFVLISPEELTLPEYVTAMLDDLKIEYSVENKLETAMPKLDVLYMTRIQRERFENDSLYDAVAGKFILTKEIMQSAKPDMRVLHPLPRVDEISVQVDTDKRAAYFRQTYYGKIMRMALIIKLLDSVNEEPVKTREWRVTDKECSNGKCITFRENDNVPYSYIAGDGTERCAYCDHILDK